MACIANYEPMCTPRTCSVPLHTDRGQSWSKDATVLKPKCPCGPSPIPGMIGCHANRSSIHTRDDWYCNANFHVKASDHAPHGFANTISSHMRKVDKRRPIAEPQNFNTEPTNRLLHVQMDAPLYDPEDVVANHHPMYPMFVLVFVCILVYLVFLAFM